jgi:peptide chain release factor 2
MKTLLSINAGAGGDDAQDWAQMLLRMYERFFSKKDWAHKRLEISYGKEAGVKSVLLEINVNYDIIKNEAGVHRLVRLSPFSAKKLRHTSFALVEVLPAAKNVSIEIKPEDLRIDTYRSSGPGGQHLNTTDSAVRITHNKSGLVVSCQSERSQIQNREKAMEVLKLRLFTLEQKKSKESQTDLKTGLRAEWGNQTRSYILHPYKMVRDEKTKKKYQNVDDILDGKLDKLIK